MLKKMLISLIEIKWKGGLNVKRFCTTLAAFLVMLASASVSTASFLIVFHHPKAPKALLK